MSTTVVEWSDSELVQHMLASSQDAWRRFGQRYDALIYAAIDRVLRSYRQEGRRGEREEVRAALLFSLVSRDMHKLRVFSFERGVQLSSWINMLATHAARDYMRSVSRKRALVTLGSERVDESHDASLCGPLHTLLAKEALADAWSALAHFSDRDRELFELLIMQDLPPEQVAHTMNISVKTVYTKKHKLMQRLQRAMDATPRQSVRPRSHSVARLNPAAAS